MMRFDRYLVGRFMFNFLWALFAFWAIFIIVNLIEHLDKFIDKAVPVEYIALYYWYFTPEIVILVMPIAVLLATLFAVGFLARRNELLAMRSVGMSLWRLSTPFLAMGLVVTAGVFALGETIYPAYEQRRDDMQRQFIRGVIQPPQMLLSNLYVPGAGGRVYYMRSFNTKTSLATDVTVQTFHEGRLVESVEMKQMWYKDSAWVAENGERRIFAATGDTVSHYETFPSAVFRDWRETPDDMVRQQIDPQKVRYAELKEAIARIRRTGGDSAGAETELALKLSFPFINLLVVLVGFPIAARTRQSGMALNFGIAMLITFVMRVVFEVFRSLGHNAQIAPWAAAWTPNAICLAGGLVALLWVRK